MPLGEWSAVCLSSAGLGCGVSGENLAPESSWVQVALGRVLVCVKTSTAPHLELGGYSTSCWGNRSDPDPSDQLLSEPRELLTQLLTRLQLVIPAALAPRAPSRLSKQARIGQCSQVYAGHHVPIPIPWLGPPAPSSGLSCPLFYLLTPHPHPG